MIDLITYIIVLLAALSLVKTFINKKRKASGGCSAGGACSTCNMCNKLVARVEQ